MTACDPFNPIPSVLSSHAHPGCRASVIIPARNEEHSLPATLDALRLQVDIFGLPLDPTLYEVIVLLNNCTDQSVEAVGRYQREHPTFRLQYAERFFPSEAAHVGTARRHLMDTAFHRLNSPARPKVAILSTDADTTVAPNWILRNLAAIEQGAEVVGGVINLKPEDLVSLDPGTLHAYRADRLYQREVACLESILDPDPVDPWPRHLDHFGASLACTPDIYRRAGGLPPVRQLEDVAFIDALRRVDARIRHAPDVSVFTSARLKGRTEVGLSGQLRLWHVAAVQGHPHMVESAAYLAHRFANLSRLRRIGARRRLPSLALYPECWRQPLRDMHPLRLGPSAFLCAVDCNRLIDETFDGPREERIDDAIANLNLSITQARAAKLARARPVEIVPAASTAQFATPAG